MDDCDGIYGIIMVSLSVYHMKMLPSGGSSTQVKSLREGIETLKDVAKTFFQKKNILLSIGFVILYRFAEGFAIKIAPLFFKATHEQGGLGLSTSEIGMIYGIFGQSGFCLGLRSGGPFYFKTRLEENLDDSMCLV